MLIDWLEQRLEPKQFASLKKLLSNLIEIVYVNAIFALVMLMLLSPFIIYFLAIDLPPGPSGNCYAPPDGCQ